MCLIFFSINQHPTYKLVVAANRDEFYNRKTAAASFWQDHPEILGGRDLEANGTWLGMTNSGRISLLTNYRDPANIDPKAPSRGKLVSDFLEGTMSGERYMNSITPDSKKYNGFNLIVGDVNELWYHSNYAAGVRKINEGFYGLSNHLLDTPWPKVQRGKERLRPVLEKSKLEATELFELLYDDQRAPDSLLPETGIGIERERALSSMFIKTPNYGSRCSTVILVDHKNHVHFSERVYDLTTFEYTTGSFEFDIHGQKR